MVVINWLLDSAMLMLLLWLSHNSFMGLVLCRVTYRLLNKHRDIAAHTSCVRTEPASSLHGVLVSRCVAKTHC